MRSVARRSSLSLSSSSLSLPLVSSRSVSAAAAAAGGSSISKERRGISGGGAAVAMGAGARTSSSSSGSGLLALSAAAVNAATDERVLHKIQGAQLFMGSAVAFLCAAHRIQQLRIRRKFGTSGVGGGAGGEAAGGETDDRGKTKRNKKALIYTRTGDRGTSSLYNGERRPKSDLTFEALGATDELNACIGLAKEYANARNSLAGPLSIIQSRLLDMGAAIATPAKTSSDSKRERTRFDPQHVQLVEKWIDDLDARLPPLKNFILPSGGLCSAHLHLARTVCRRAERAVVPLVDSEEVDPEVGVYLNRLSDFLFTAARYAAQSDGHEETVWIKP